MSNTNWKRNSVLVATHLVIDLLSRTREGDILFEDVASLYQLLGLGPVVEGAGNVDLGRGMLPEKEICQSN